MKLVFSIPLFLSCLLYLIRLDAGCGASKPNITPHEARHQIPVVNTYPIDGVTPRTSTDTHAHAAPRAPSPLSSLNGDHAYQTELSSIHGEQQSRFHSDSDDENDQSFYTQSNGSRTRSVTPTDTELLHQKERALAALQIPVTQKKPNRSLDLARLFRQPSFNHPLDTEQKVEKLKKYYLTMIHNHKDLDQTITCVELSQQDIAAYIQTINTKLSHVASTPETESASQEGYSNADLAHILTLNMDHNNFNQLLSAREELLNEQRAERLKIAQECHKVYQEIKDAEQELSAIGYRNTTPSPPPTQK